jgi:hypothetical protein
MNNTATFRQWLGENLPQLSFEARQAIAQCLISQVIVTGAAVDIHFVFPFASTPQAARRLPKEPEGTPGHFYRLRLAHFDGIEVMATMGREAMEAKRALLVVEGRVQLMRSMDPAPIDDHHDLLLGFAEGRHHLMHIWAQLLGIKVGDDCREDFGGAILDGAHDAEQHPTGDAAPGAITSPSWPFEGLLTFDLTLAQRTRREASTLHCAPPACTGQGKAPQDGCVFIEHNNLTTARLVLERSECDRAIGESSRGGRQATGRAVGASMLFFTAQRTLSRPSRTPVCWANTAASSRQLHWE